MPDVDYLVVGAGAVGLVFADQMLAESDAKIAIVDRRAGPGGHWNDAYPFVTLHQPANFYGANSRPLLSGRLNQSGLNKGYHELPSGGEVLSYFQRLMEERLLPSGRVQFFPDCEARPDGSFVSRAGVTTKWTFRKLVDTTFFETQTAVTHKPEYDVSDGVTLTSPRHLLDAVGAHERFCIVGGGKTAMDVAVWLLQAGVDADAIRCIVPRDSWVADRATLQPGDQFFEHSMGGLANQLEAVVAADGLDDLFDRLEAAGQLARIDPSIRPTMYRGAVVSKPEIELLRTIRDVVRLGYVHSIAPREIVLDHGTITADPDCLYIDCSARALSRRAPEPVFQRDKIVVQMVRSQLICISAAAIAHVETAYSDDAEKNALCAPIPAAWSAADWPRGALADMHAAKRWNEDKDMRRWLSAQRIWGFGTTRTDPDAMAIFERIKAARPRAEGNLERLVASLPG